MKFVSEGPIDSMFANGAWEEMLKAKGLPEYKRKHLAPYLSLVLSARISLLRDALVRYLPFLFNDL